jgi:hypothetical protein
MFGTPLTRRADSAGRWAYTLYDTGGGAPFVHALDTQTRSARCIDLPMLRANPDLASMKLRVSPNGGEISVTQGLRTVATIDPMTFAASLPQAAPVEVQQRSNSAAVLIGALAGLGFLGVGALLTVRRRARIDAGVAPAAAEGRDDAHGEASVVGRTG